MLSFVAFGFCGNKDSQGFFESLFSVKLIYKNHSTVISESVSWIYKLNLDLNTDSKFIQLMSGLPSFQNSLFERVIVNNFAKDYQEFRGTQQYRKESQNPIFLMLIFKIYRFIQVNLHRIASWFHNLVFWNFQVL